MTKSVSRAGRPRSFDQQVALGDALDVFWRKGYEATSLDDLTEATQLSRSSFYAAFGSKRELLLHAYRRYADAFHADMKALAEEHDDANAALRAVVKAMVDARPDNRGCFCVNAIVELAPCDPELAELGRAHIQRMCALLEELITRRGTRRPLARSLAATLMTLTMGSAVFRKASVAEDTLKSVQKQALGLLDLG
ncbi:TetR/AcrR family transcriptional regulator [Dyella kyungheensis]|uniref:TetR/AcrR family transcriptional regulator n=1 Tax=Dyella kyungheensis TaxID=1242174 RepID=A0ABS2JLM9_9GAMM|nr:TetR/AcrR family transcriptional regulator [Dyella kyungheensis]MBM7119941.1 TetR/AcrR family transcriptional regulator [Dyella kyungheensis]